MTTENQTAVTKKAYQRPELTAFGTVRNLTGGSKGNSADANATVANPNQNKGGNA